VTEKQNSPVVCCMGIGPLEFGLRSNELWTGENQRNHWAPNTKHQAPSTSPWTKDL